MITIIQINEAVCIRLSAFAKQNNLNNLSDAIQHILDSQPAAPGGTRDLSALTAGTKLRNIITYFPAGEDSFKKELLKTKRAFIRIFYADGRPPTDKEWNAHNISKASTVHGNLASGHLRDWREKGICKVEVSIEPRPKTPSEAKKK